MIKISGKYRVQSIYKGDDRSYITLKDKADGSIVKVAMENPINKAVVDDGLLDLDGVLKSSLYSNNVTLAFEGNVTLATEK